MNKLNYNNEVIIFPSREANETSDLLTDVGKLN